MDACYFSLIRRSREGELVGWVPDLYGVTAAGRLEHEVLRVLTSHAGALLDRMKSKGLPLPRPTPPHALPLGDREGRYRRLLLILCQTLQQPGGASVAMKFFVPSMVVLFASMTAVHAQDGDARRGLSIARSVCADCHAVQAKELQSPNPKSPTFPELAKTPGMTSAALTVALTTPHAGMPMFRLSADQRADIIAYVLSLKQQGAQPGK